MSLLLHQYWQQYKEREYQSLPLYTKINFSTIFVCSYVTQNGQTCLVFISSLSRLCLVFVSSLSRLRLAFAFFRLDIKYHYN